MNEESRCTLTPTVSKTSAGALEFIDMYCVKEIDLFFESILNAVKDDLISFRNESVRLEDRGRES